MSDPKRDRDIPQQLDAYLDGRLSPEEVAAFEQELKSSPALRKQVDAQREIDKRLGRLLASADKPPFDVERLVQTNADGDSKLHDADVRTQGEARELGAEASKAAANNDTANSRRRHLMMLAIVAAVAISAVIVRWTNDRPSKIEPYFEPRSLVSLYHETVKQGFRPYYFCEDAERFALTFAERQQTPLRLLEMPTDRSMVGLSYPGGLSRDTTAILCYASDEPVIVFVDRTEFDVAGIGDADQATHVHQIRLGDLTLYEVSPFGEAKFLEYLSLVPSTHEIVP